MKQGLSLVEKIHVLGTPANQSRFYNFIMASVHGVNNQHGEEDPGHAHYIRYVYATYVLKFMYNVFLYIVKHVNPVYKCIY